jgi:undecaprenyl-diphosphatase
MNFLAFHRADAAMCTAFNRINHRSGWSALFGAVSRIGDGVVWYTTLVLLPLVYGMGELPLVACLAVNGLVCTALYKWLKGSTQRPRPCEVHRHLRTTVAPLDRFSFPSGHTLHAVGFTVLIGAVHPTWCWWMVPFTALVALSRLVLGLHYPSDVLAGAAIGGGASAATYLLGSSCGWF